MLPSAPATPNRESPSPGRLDPPTQPSDPARTRDRILAAATEIFAEHGFSGAKVSAIVARAKTTKPMIYYHFDSKEGLFAAVLEHVYAGMRGYEQSVELDDPSPENAMRTLVATTFDYHAAHPDWVRIISDANIHRGQHIAASATIASKNSAILAILERLLARGVRAGVFRPGVDALHLHLLMASCSFYRVSNRHTWRVIFGRDLAAPDDSARQRQMLIDAVLRLLAPP